MKVHAPDERHEDLGNTVASAELDSYEDRSCDRTRFSPVGDARVEGMSHEEAHDQDVRTGVAGLAVGTIEEGFLVLIPVVGRLSPPDTSFDRVEVVVMSGCGTLSCQDYCTRQNQTSSAFADCYLRGYFD